MPQQIVPTYSRRPAPYWISAIAVGALLLGAFAAVFAKPAAAEAQVQPVITKDLADLPGKEGLLLRVTYPPGSADQVHRHDAHGFVYVEEGSVVMQVRGGEPVTLHAGQGFYEGPNDVHVIGRNASKTQPAKLVVFLVKNKGAPFLTLVP
jgi:quercetin dioxygenase-like cupin family protein